MAKNLLNEALENLAETPLGQQVKRIATDAWNNREQIAKNYLMDQYIDKAMKEHAIAAQNSSSVSGGSANSGTNTQAIDISSLNPFIESYRNALGRQRDLGMQSLEASRRNAFQNIMASANTGGMMYSNFPARAKMQYDTGTYMPNRAEVENTYQTGLDSLRNNVVKAINTAAEYQEAANASNAANDPLKNFRINDSDDYAYWNNRTGTTQFRNANKEKIRFGTAAKRAGYSNPQDILDYAAATLQGQDEVNRLNNLWERAQKEGKYGFAYNVGDSFQKNSYDFLSEAENDFLDSLGLSFL